MLIFAVGTGVSLFGYRQAVDRDEERVRDSLRRNAEWETLDFQAKFDDASVSIEALADFVAANPNFSPDEFHRFAKKARGRDPLTRLIWAPQVSASERPEFEAKVRATQSLSDYRISDIKDGIRVPAPERDRYLPVEIEESFEGAPLVAGFDFFGEPSRRAAAGRALSLGEPIATDSLVALVNGQPQRRIALFWPVAREGAALPNSPADAASIGVAVGTMIVDDLFRFMIRESPDLTERISVFTGDAPAKEVGNFVLAYLPEGKQIVTDANAVPPLPDGYLRVARSFTKFGRQWQVVYEFPPSFVGAMTSSARWVYLGLGFALTLMLSTYSVYEQLRRMTIEAIVEERTRDLERSKEHLESVQRVAGIGSAELDVATMNAIWSEQMFRLLGLRRGDIRPGIDDFWPLVHPDDRKRLRDYIDRNLRGEETEVSEYRIMRKDGALRWMQRSSNIIRDPSGKPTKLLVVWYDIDDRKKLEEDIRRSREHLAWAQRVGKIGSCEIDIESGHIYWSEEMYRIWGYEPASGDPPPLGSLVAMAHPDDRALVRQFDSGSLAGQDIRPFDFRVVLPDGSIRWINRQSVVTRNAAGVPTALLITNQDVTTRMAAEQALRQAKELLAAVVESSGDAIASKSVDLRITSWNAAAKRIFGYDAEEILDQHCAILEAPGREKDFELILERILAGQLVDGFETQGRRKDGRIIDIAITEAPLHDATGRIIGSSVVVRDISAAKAIQARRLELEAQLHQSQRMEAIGQLTGGIAHDFNNLLTVIIGRLGLLGERLAGNDELREWVNVCLNAAKRGASLTRSMLTFARQQPLNPSSVDLEMAIADMVQMLPRTLGETIEIKVKFAPDLWRCEADTAQLQSALLNLALNARDAMPDGGVLTIEAANVRLDANYAAANPDIAPGDYVVLTVSDNGDGMAPDTVSRAFEPFFTTKETGKGTGLGLSMVYGFAKQSGGHVKIHSELGIGTTVRLYIPRSFVAETDAARPASQAAADVELGGGLVLLVEDDEGIRELATLQLKRLGYAVIACASGPEGLKELDRHPEIVLLVTDLTLPGGMSGYELAEHAIEQLPELRVLYMSGYSEDAVAGHGHARANIRILQKPFEMADLAQHIKMVLSQKPGHRV